MLTQLSQLSEATKETSTGKVHKAEPGGYGRKFDTDEEGDEKKEKKPEVKRGRGRPKKGADSDTGEVKTYSGAKELQSYMVGNLPKGKLPGKASKKHSLKEWVEEIENKYVAEAGLSPTQTLVPGMQAGGNAAQPTIIDIKNNPALKAALDKAAKDKQITTVGIPQTGASGSTTSGTAPTAMSEESVEMEEAGDKWIQKAVKHPGAFTKKAKSHGMTPSEFAKKVLANKDDYPAKTEKQAVLAKTLSKLKEVEQPTIDNQTAMGAGLGAGRSQTTLEAKEDEKAMKKDHKAEKVGKEVTKDIEKVEEAAKPDYIDLDKDGNKKETMKKAADDKKKKVNESMHKHTAAKLLGKAHALAKEAYNCKYEDMEEAKCYHEGFKEGLDECYGQMPIVGLVKETDAIPATVSGMADQEIDMYEMDKTEWMKHKAKTTSGDTFKAFGQTMHDKDVLDDSMFEGWDKELNELLTESEEVNEGMTVSISKGQQGMPDSVSVSAQDHDADQLLGLIKQAGLGLFGDGGSSNPSSAMAMPSIQPDNDQPAADIEVVDDHDGMLSLIRKMSGQDSATDDGYEEENSEEHDHEHANEETCNECGYMESKCECDKEQVDEVESEDQMTYEVAEDNAPDSGAAETTADENAEAAEDAALAQADNLKEWANQIGKGPGKGTDAGFEQDIEFMTKFIAGGLNKPKSTGQTTVPVIAGQDTRMEDPLAWARLAGIKK